MNKLSSILLLSFAIFISSCSDFKFKTALDLEVGECYVNVGLNDTEAGVVDDLDYVEVVSCSEPHNFEIIADYSSVPQAHRSSKNPIDDICSSNVLDLVASIHPNANDLQFEKIAVKFDERFNGYYNFTRIEPGSEEPDLNSNFNCAIQSKDSLIVGDFREIIEGFD